MSKGSWYVIQVTTGSERRFCSLIELLSPPGAVEECFSPRYATQIKKAGEWIDVQKSLLPGYVIVVSDRLDLVIRTLRLGRSALVGVRGPVDLGALDGPAGRVAAEPAAARSALVHLREYGAHHLDERPPAGKTCTTRLRRLSSLSARSRTLLMCRPTWCS